MKTIVQLILGTMALLAFEVNTHQAITRCALTEECGMQKILNLESFVKNTELNSIEVVYKDEIFEKYNRTYKFYIEDENKTGFRDWNITIIHPNYQGMMEAGVILEDSLYHNQVPFTFGGDGRFNNHFYAVQFDSREACTGGINLEETYFRFALASDMQTPHTLCTGFQGRTDNIDWVFNETVDLGLGRVNDYGLEDAFEYMKKSFEGDETSRRKYQAKFFVTLGMMSHMLQDLHSPAHVRDGSHAFGDHLEIYGRYDGGFNLRNGIINPNNEPEIEEAIRTFDMPSYLNGMNFKSLEEIYYKEARWVSNNFFSEAHNWKETAQTQNGSGLLINRTFDKDTIFDKYNTNLSFLNTIEGFLPNPEDNDWRYIISATNSVPDIYGDISAFEHNIFAFIQKGFFSTFDFSSEHFFDNEHMIKPIYRLENDGSGNYELITDTGYQASDKTPLKHTAINVIPRAVASTQAMLRFFFRGQIST